MSDKKLVKVKILKYVGAWTPGQVVEVDEATASHLCHVNELSDGVSVVRHVRAMLLEEAEALDVASKDVSQLTSAEAKALGVKNIVDSSPEADLDKAAKDLAKQAEAEMAAEEKASKKVKNK